MNRDFAEMLSELSAAGADYIVVGGYAVIAHGSHEPRAITMSGYGPLQKTPPG